ncbi:MULTISPECIES: YciI family protein [Sphingobium]|uniref:YCII-related domain-containing protein n=2 Tax=Sphingobium TaxID=165695 RepID=A0A8E1C105_9SPHN|nr:MULTISPECIES: YciI family protein [Sphingobium]EPR12543.1 hypothetical protein M527_01295 [Sphingobium indicum IP26]AMK20755.1 hypothetical protein K663_21998 [Sphingobium sp. MI1205]AMK21404.1 hypothetical protein K426_02230 [Sphingobium sp. TKS]EQB03537.1 hypothetical protein L286_12460 [Sphingobium sp. HDIP04]EQB15484.1 hypothetical protein RLDS_11250 [Sphingobium lactosutens DS20]
MYVAIFFQDLPGTAARRQAVVSEHRKYMEARSSQVLAAGATFTDDGKAVKGGSYVISVASMEEARAFVDNDPFTKAGLRAFVTIQPWIKAVFDGQFNIPTDDSPLYASSVA